MGARLEPRVLIVCAAGSVWGKELVSLALARQLRSRGWRVEFATSLWGCAEFRERLAAEGFTYHQLWLGFIAAAVRWDPIVMTLDQLRRWPSLLMGYRRLLATTRPDVVVHTNWHHALLLSPLLNRTKDIYWSHELLPDKWRYAAVFRLIARGVARMVCVSYAACRSLERLGIATEKLAVVHNGTATGHRLPAPKPGERLRVGIIGQIAPWKGHEDVLAAVGLLAAKGHQVRLKIFGRGPDDFVALLRAQAAALGIADQVEWRGFVADQRAIYRQIDLCVVPSRFEEPFATTALEASLSARPLICTSVGGLPEIVEAGRTGLVVAPGRPDLLACAIDAFIRRPSLVAQMGLAGQRRAQAEFSETAFGDRFVKVIQELRSAG